MDSGITYKPKVTVKLNYDKPSTSTGPHTRIQISTPASPAKSYVSSSNTEPTFRPKAKVNSSATTRKAGGSTVSTSTSSTPRAGSPAKLAPRVKNGVLSPTNGTSHGSLRSPPATSAPATPELRRTVKTHSASSLRAEETRTRTISTSLRHAPSMVNFRPSSSSVVSGSGSVVSGSTSASVSPRLLFANSTVGFGDRASSPTPKIRSKVSNLAKAAVESPPRPPSPASPPILFPSTRLTTAPRTRTPSVSSSVNQIYQQHPQPPTSPPQHFYPITTTVSAANPHRFTPSRPPTAPRTNTSAGHHIFQSFSQPSSTPHVDQSSPSNRPRSAGGLLNGKSPSAKVDPASIPLPPHSPPASAVSFSSRSSVSRSSANAPHLGTGGGDAYASSSTDSGSRLSPDAHYQGGSDGLRATLDNLMQYTSGANSATDDDDSGLDRDTDGEGQGTGKDKVKAEAKSIRKIADLEITNRSLLAINASLEATKHRQAKEIHELRRKLRESRLILPPRAYRAVTSQDPTELEDDEDDLEGDLEGSDAEDIGGDEIYKRVKLILDTLLVSGKAALETQPKDFPEGSKGAAKVLSPEEQRDYHGTNEADQDEQGSSTSTPPPEHNPLETQTDSRQSLQQRQRHDYESAGIPQGSKDGNHRDGDKDYNNFNYDDDDSFDGVGNETITSEDEVEAMTISALSPPSSLPPPILIAQPT